jgi:3-hydroxyacyl-[acyl-carrier-protein] dehydratase
MATDPVNILELIPQRPPMVMVDELMSCDEFKTITRFRVTEKNIFLKDGFFTEPGLIENIAQTAATRTGWLARRQDGDEKLKIPVGVIGAIKDFRLHFLPEVGSVLTTELEAKHEIMQASVVYGRVIVDGKTAAECEMKIFLTS